MSERTTWEACTVRDVIERHFCGPSPDCEERQIFAPEEWGVLKTTAITWAGWNDAAHKVLPKAFWEQSQIEVHEGDVLVTKAGPRHRVGVVCHVPSTRSRLVVSGKMIGLRPKTEVVDARFLAGFLGTKEPQKYIHDRTTGMAESQVNFANEVLLDAPLRLPPVHEQHLIARVLDTLDTAIRETEALIGKLKVVKQGLLHDLLTRGIDANGQLRPPQSEAPQLYKESPLGWIPREWDVQSLDKITATPICYGIVQVLDYVSSGVPVLAIRDLLGDYATGIHRTASSIDLAYPRSRVKPGDVLLSIKGTIGRIGMVPPHFLGNISRDIALIRPTSGIRSQFLAQMLRSPIGQTIIKQAQVGTTRAEISIAPLRKLEIAFPDVKEQVRTEEILESADIRLEEEQAKLNKLKSQKIGLMNDLLTGRVRVTPAVAQTEA
ncbi:MAG: restriction endonuclease subunit S [Pseudomonas profundi]|uniref:restriction endonuclease subunit S n=2 Tax=Pseudomonas profundi TaxID=1981513 RepID=UPI00300272F9